MAKEIILAESAGFCFGVKRAVDMAAKYHDVEELKVSTLGPLIHNNDVIKRLETHNIHAIEERQIGDLDNQDVLVIRSHGVTPQVIDQINSTEAKLVDATCPYVMTIHKKVARHYADGYQIIIIGDENHPEVIGINGWCDNTAIITRDGKNLPHLDKNQKVCVVSQTTEQLVNYKQVLGAVSAICDQVVAFNTICSATKTRQESAATVAKLVDLMIVIGGKHSSNTKKLVEISKTHCEQTIFVENSAELPLDIISQAQYQKIGITAGASTPDWIIDEVIDVVENIE